MASDIEQNVREEIQQLLKNINAAWVKGCPEDLEEYFHEDMVIFDPGFGRRGIGKKYVWKVTRILQVMPL